MNAIKYIVFMQENFKNRKAGTRKTNILHKYHHTMSLRVECDEHYKKQMLLSRTLVVCSLTGHNGRVSAGMNSSIAIYICACICA